MMALAWTRRTRVVAAGVVRVLGTVAAWGLVLGLLRVVAPGGPPGVLSLATVAVPYVCYEVVAIGWVVLSRSYRSGLVVVGIAVVVGWVALDPVPGGVGVVIAGVFVFALDTVPIERWLDALVRAYRIRRPTSTGGFGPPPADDPTTRRYPHPRDDRPDRDENREYTCADCGEDLRQLLVGRACPNCGSPTEDPPPD